MKKLLLICLVALCFQGIAQRVVKEGPLTVYNHSKLHTGGTGGNVKTYWNDDKKPFTGTYIEIGFDSVKIGETNYLNGQKHGICKEFYEKGGKLHWEAEYRNGVVLWKKEYDREGELKTGTH